MRRKVHKEMCVRIVALLAAAVAMGVFAAPEEVERQMRNMLDAIADDARATQSYTGQARISDPVMTALSEVRRDLFVPRGQEQLAYFNRPLPVGHNQTISQPFIVALMTDLLAPQAHHMVLEIGTGSGYQAAVLAQLVERVYTIEIIDALAEQAAARLSELGYVNVQVKQGDGWHGWPEMGAFDGIIVTAVADDILSRLFEQLKPEGRLVMPIKRPLGFEQLIVVTKDDRGRPVQRDVLPVRFVPLTRKEQQN